MHVPQLLSAWGWAVPDRATLPLAHTTPLIDPPLPHTQLDFLRSLPGNHVCAQAAGGHSGRQVSGISPRGGDRPSSKASSPLGRPRPPKQAILGVSVEPCSIC